MSGSAQRIAVRVGGLRERARLAARAALTPSPHAFRPPRTPHELAHPHAHATRQPRSACRPFGRHAISRQPLASPTTSRTPRRRPLRQHRPCEGESNRALASARACAGRHPLAHLGPRPRRNEARWRSRDSVPGRHARAAPRGDGARLATATGTLRRRSARSGAPAQTRCSKSRLARSIATPDVRSRRFCPIPNRCRALSCACTHARAAVRDGGRMAAGEGEPV